MRNDKMSFENKYLHLEGRKILIKEAGELLMPPL